MAGLGANRCEAELFSRSARSDFSSTGNSIKLNTPSFPVRGHGEPLGSLPNVIEAKLAAFGNVEPLAQEILENPPQLSVHEPYNWPGKPWQFCYLDSDRTLKINGRYLFPLIDNDLRATSDLSLEARLELAGFHIIRELSAATLQLQLGQELQSSGLPAEALGSTELKGCIEARRAALTALLFHDASSELRGYLATRVVPIAEAAYTEKY